jgi:uncharacterized protein YkwD
MKIRFIPLILGFSVLCFLISAFNTPVNLENDVLKYTNNFRRAQGLPALIMRNDLNSIARNHSEDMADGVKGFGHGGFDKREKEVERIMNMHSMAENVAYGSESGREVVDMWIASKGHRKNLLGNYQYIGIGTARDERGIVYFTQIFVR